MVCEREKICVGTLLKTTALEGETISGFEMQLMTEQKQ